MKTKRSFFKDYQTDLNSTSISKEIDIARNQCELFAKRTNVDFNDLFTEALERLPNIRKNFIPELNNNYVHFLKTSIKGYLKNYVRDKSFSTKIPRKITEIYMKTRSFASYLIASQHTKWTEEEIRDAHETVFKYRTYNVKELKSWTVVEDSGIDNSKYVNSIEIIQESEIDFDLLNDHFVNELSEIEMVKKYGYLYKERIEEQTDSIKEIASINGFKSTEKNDE